MLHPGASAPGVGVRDWQRKTYPYQERGVGLFPTSLWNDGTGGTHPVVASQASRQSVVTEA